mmetsp:Transcript_15900/g.38974  ORF Transcript_15900/g.38974 Transcript_15900/m.38974 type:complete len:123 (-) Transcript_15900:98-466(-)
MYVFVHILKIGPSSSRPTDKLLQQSLGIMLIFLLRFAQCSPLRSKDLVLDTLQSFPAAIGYGQDQGELLPDEIRHQRQLLPLSYAIVGLAPSKIPFIKNCDSLFLFQFFGFIRSHCAAEERK